MGWRDLLEKPGETIVLPWVGGRSLRSMNREWGLEGKLPPHFGWYRFSTSGRKARMVRPENGGDMAHRVQGYLVGDRLIPDHARSVTKMSKVADILGFEPVFLVEAGLDRFSRIVAGRAFEGGPLIFDGLAMPLGPEEEVLTAFLDQERDVSRVVGVPPALDLAFKVESWQRKEELRRRAEEEARIRAEEEARLLEERRQDLAKKLGDGAGRRALAALDFEAAARAALLVGGAELLDVRQGHVATEKVLRFKIGPRRFECVCHRDTLRIIDAGVCLIDHANGDRKDDALLTLESLPAVLQEAIRIGRLVVFRHV